MVVSHFITANARKMPKVKRNSSIISKSNANQRQGDAVREDELIEWDTSSSSSDEQVIAKDERVDSPILISTYSSDDENENNLTRTLTAHCTPTGRHNSTFCSYVSRCSGSGSGSASDSVRRNPMRRMRMKIVKRKSLQLNSEQVPRSPLKGLGARDNVGFETPPTVKVSNNISPWQRVRSVFTPLRCTSNRNKEISQRHIEACLTDNEQEDVVHRKCSQTIDPPSQLSTQSANQSSELDLFVALLERETAPTPANSKRIEFKKKKRCPKGSYMFHMRRILECARTDRKFLMHDKKFGLCSGQLLRVVKIEETFGVHLVTVMLESAQWEPIELEQELQKPTVNTIILVVDSNLAVSLRIGSRLEQFFKSDLTPYVIETTEGKKEAVYVQPNKLLLL